MKKSFLFFGFAFIGILAGSVSALAQTTTSKAKAPVQEKQATVTPAQTPAKLQTAQPTPAQNAPVRQSQSQAGQSKASGTTVQPAPAKVKNDPAQNKQTRPAGTGTTASPNSRGQVAPAAATKAGK